MKIYDVAGVVVIVLGLLLSALLIGGGWLVIRLVLVGLRHVLAGGLR